MLRLIGPTAEELVGYGSASVPIRWCLEEQDLQKLRQHGVDPATIFVAIVVKYDNGSEDRQLVPFKDQPMTYVTFHRPGTHKIYARLVWEKVNRKEVIQRLKNYFLEKRSWRSYEYDVLRTGDDGKLRLTTFSLEGELIEGAEALAFEIPEQYFAKERPLWFSELVNWWFLYPPADECDFRARLWTLIPKIPVLIVGGLIFGFWVYVSGLTLLAIALFCGWRGISLKPFLHPLITMNNDDIPILLPLSEQVKETGTSSYYLTRADGKRRSLWFLLLHPLSWTIIFWCWQRGILEGKWSAQIIISILIATLLGWYCVGRIIRWVKARHSTFVIDEQLAREFGRQRVQRYKQACEEQFQKIAAFATCSVNTQPAVSALPREYRTFRLRFLELKAKVCRPFAQ